MSALKIGDIFRVVKGGGPHRLRVGQLWEITDSKWMGAQFTKDAKRNGLKSGMSTMILNGFHVASSELRAGRIVHAEPEAKPLRDKREDALREAGEALDAAMKTVAEDRIISLLGDPQLVDKMHRALNAVVAITGTPWRNK